jgi:dCMP deaminase
MSNTLELQEVIVRGDLFWHRFYLDMANHVATASKDPTTQVGAVLVSLCRRKMAIGYNGFPPGIADDSRLHDRALKRDMVLHAEDNAIANADFDTKTVPSRLYVTGHPCHRCAVRILREPGIKEVIYCQQKEFSKDWEESFKLSAALFQEKGVLVLAL